MAEFDLAIEAAWRAQSEIASDAFWAERRAKYRAYLATPQWRAKRERVLDRARWQCEGCADAPAREVHHLTYAHIYDEFLFELVALCASCHERWHAGRAPPFTRPVV